MDCTNELFAEYLKTLERLKEEKEERINEIREQRKEHRSKEDNANIKRQIESVVTEIQVEMDNAVCRAMTDVIETKGFDLPLSEACLKLNIDMTYFTERKGSNLEKIDYIIAPQGAATYFKKCKRYHFWERRLLKWKKFFVNRESFIRFLTENMYVVNGEESQEPISEEKAKHFLQYRKLYRKCGVKDIVIETKRAEFLRKTEKDIQEYRKIGIDEILENCISANGNMKEGVSADDMERQIAELDAYLKEEIKETKKVSVKDLALTCKMKEVNDYISTHNHNVYIIKGDTEITLFEFL